MSKYQSNLSPRRSRILKEFLTAAHEQSGPKRGQRFTWTKRPKFNGFQSTLNSKDNMRELKPSAPSRTDLEPWQIQHNSAGVPKWIGKRNTAAETPSEAPLSQGTGDPLMTELENMRQNSGGGEKQDEDMIFPSANTAWQLEPAETLAPYQDHSRRLFSKGKDPDRTHVFSRVEGSPQPMLEDSEDEDPEADPTMLQQPETRPISHDQLIMEVKGIYAGLVMVEAKCIEVDAEIARESSSDKCPGMSPPLSNDQWGSLIALHKQLLHEHHDFFLASQHPAASPAPRRLATKYSMPSRMFEHGIQSLLGLIHQRDSISGRHRREFLQATYSVLDQLMESVPSMIGEWTQLRQALDEYDLILKRLCDPSVTDLAERSGSGDPCTAAESVANSLDLDRRTKSDLPFEPSRAEFGDWYVHKLDPTNPLEREYTYWSSLVDHLRLPDYVVDTLTGWLYYGQAIANASFNTYSKIF